MTEMKSKAKQRQEWKERAEIFNFNKRNAQVIASLRETAENGREAWEQAMDLADNDNYIAYLLTTAAGF